MSNALAWGSLIGVVDYLVFGCGVVLIARSVALEVANPMRGTKRYVEFVRTAGYFGPVESMIWAFDIAKEHETLLLVRVLRGCERVEAAKHLIDIVTHPTLATGPRRQAVSALATLHDREGIKALIKLWERDPRDAGAYVQHALSLAAKRQLKDVSAAREWAKTLR